jgi:hypothetical protein
MGGGSYRGYDGMLGCEALYGSGQLIKRTITCFNQRIFLKAAVLHSCIANVEGERAHR